MAKKKPLYDRPARQGEKDSELEETWSKEFKVWGWDAVYVGRRRCWADFYVRFTHRGRKCGVFIEIKPDTKRDFVTQAAERAFQANRNILIVTGNPGYAKWYAALDGHLFTIPYHPRPVQCTGGGVATKWEVETIGDFLEAVHNSGIECECHDPPVVLTVAGTQD